MATANIAAQTAHSNVTPIRPGIVVRPDGREQSAVGLNRRLYEKATAKLIKHELEGGDPKAAHFERIMQKVAANALPSLQLRLIIRDDRSDDERLREAAGIVAIKRAELELIRARASAERHPFNSDEFHRACVADDAARQSLLEALRAYVAIPATRRVDINAKRHAVGSVWIKHHADLREAIEADETAFKAQQAAKKEGRRNA